MTAIIVGLFGLGAGALLFHDWVQKLARDHDRVRRNEERGFDA